MSNLGSIDSKFRFVILAAKRARQLYKGAQPLVTCWGGRKPVRMAQEEVAAGLIDYEPLEDRSVESTQGAKQTSGRGGKKTKSEAFSARIAS